MFKIFQKKLDAPRIIEAALCIAIVFVICTVVAESMHAPMVLIEGLVICVLASALTGLVVGVFVLPNAARNLRRDNQDSDTGK